MVIVGADMNLDVGRHRDPGTCGNPYRLGENNPCGLVHPGVFCLCDLCPFGLGHRGSPARLSDSYANDDGYRLRATEGTGSGVDEIDVGDDDASGPHHCYVACACDDRRLDRAHDHGWHRHHHRRQ